MATARKPFYRNLTVQVLTAILIGILLGHFYPSVGVDMKPLGDVFIRLIKMVIGPVVFLTVVTGISHAGSMTKVGRVGLKALIYFEVVTTLCLIIGLVVVNVFKPGAGVTAVAASKADIAGYLKPVSGSTVDMMVKLVPENIFGAFAAGDLLPILLFSILFGAALTAIGPVGKPLEDIFERLSQALFKVIGIIMYVAPIGAFGAMAFTIGRYGIAALIPLANLMLCVYVTMALFVVLVLSAIARATGFSLWALLRYIRDEILLVLGTSSTETVLPQIMEKLRRLGCSKTVVGLVVPTGYSFNQDGSAIYLSISMVFIAQVYGVDLSLWHQIGILLVLMVTSKGAAGVTGSGFIILAASLDASKAVPLEGLALLLGVERFMSEARAITNLIGNAVATIVISKLEGELDEVQAAAVLGNPRGELAMGTAPVAGRTAEPAS